MKILAIGDAHGDLKKIKQIPLKNIDLILLTGDLGKASLARKMSFNNIERKKQNLPEKLYTPKQRKAAFMEAYTSTIALIKYLSKQAQVYTIFGNVESSNKETRELSQEIGIKLPFLYNSLNKLNNVRIINNRLGNFRGIKIGGLQYFIDTSWVQEFKPSEFQDCLNNAKGESKKAKKVLNDFGHLDILVCHQPPYGILDKVKFKGAPKNWMGKHAGSNVVFDYIKRKSPKYVFCGHIHEAKGRRKLGKTEIYNLGICGYKIIEFPDN